MARLVLLALLVGVVAAPAWGSWPRAQPLPPTPASVDPDPAALRALPLAERCALTIAVAGRVLEAHDWGHDLPVRDGAVGFAILLPEDVPLLAEGEACAASALTRQTNGVVALTLDPAKIERPYLFVDWNPGQARGSQTLRFTRNLGTGAPQLNIEKYRRMRAGRTMGFEGEAPTMQVDATRVKDTWDVHLRLDFATRPAPAR